MIDAPTDNFSLFYLLLILTCLFIAYLTLLIAQRMHGSGTLPTVTLEVAQLAYLVGGKRRVIQAALASLGQRTAVRVVGDLIEGKSPLLVGKMTPVESEVLRCLLATPLKPRQLYDRCQIDRNLLRSQLQNLGLAMTDSQQQRLHLISAVIASAPALAGIIRLQHRLPQHRPVILLGFLCLVPAMLGLVVALIPIRTNQVGLMLLKSLRAKEPYLGHIGYQKSLGLSPTAVGRAVAMYGMRALRDSHLSRLAELIDPPIRSGDGGGDSSGGDSGGGHSSGGSFGDAF